MSHWASHRSDVTYFCTDHTSKAPNFAPPRSFKNLSTSRPTHVLVPPALPTRMCQGSTSQLPASHGHTPQDPSSLQLPCPKLVLRGRPPSTASPPNWSPTTRTVTQVPPPPSTTSSPMPPAQLAALLAASSPDFRQVAASQSLRITSSPAQALQVHSWAFDGYFPSFRRRHCSRHAVWRPPTQRLKLRVTQMLLAVRHHRSISCVFIDLTAAFYIAVRQLNHLPARRVPLRCF